MSKLRRGDVFFADLGHKCRPYLVVQNDTGNKHSSRTIVVPITSKIRSQPTHCTICWGSIRPSVVQCEEIMHIDVNPCWRAVEHLPPHVMRHVDKCLKIAIGVI
jgi:mRNA interferase MazF